MVTAEQSPPSEARMNGGEGGGEPDPYEGQTAHPRHLEQTEDEARVSEEQAVKALLLRIKKAKQHWEKDFERMKRNSEFVSGLQWDGQTKIQDENDRYVCNLTMRMIRNKVATLYARNPEAEAIRRERMDFVLWDQSVEMLQEAMMGAMAGDMMSVAVIADWQHGRQMQALVEKVCKTLKVLYQYQVDASKPEFKEQMKQLVTRVVTCGVGYCVPSFVREGTPPLSTVDARHSMIDRAKKARQILDKIENEKVKPEDAEMETLKSLMLSLGSSTVAGDEYELQERIEFDFPPAQSIIPDERCRSLKEFIASREVYQEFVLPLDEVNAFFDLVGDEAIKPSSELVNEQDGDQQQVHINVDEKSQAKQPKVKLYRAFNHPDKTHCFVAEGHKRFIVKPEPLYPCVSGFWPLFALTFNDLEVIDEPDCKTSVFPPSDVDLARDPAKEYNRTRDANRAQRNANAPTYLTRKGTLTENDRRKIADREPNEVVELEGIPADKTPADVIQVLQVAKLDPFLYETKSVEQDLQLAAGAQQADIGPAQPNVTATVGNIAEQNKMTVSTSNIDDLDGFLTRIARASGELMLQGMSAQTVQRIVGPGAVWPEQNKEEFLNQIVLTIKAASSGRPNQALETSKFMQIAPVLLQAGANPIAVIEEGVRRMDDRLDVQRFFPLPGQAMMTQLPSQPQGPRTPGGSPSVGLPQGGPPQPQGGPKPNEGGTPALAAPGPQPAPAGAF